MPSQNNLPPVELELHNQVSSTQDWNTSTAPVDSDAVVEASRAADSTVPDGGYGWVVLFGCGVIIWWSVGTSYSWGIIQGALVQQGLSSPSTLSFVGSLTPTFISVMALVNARLIRLLGARNTALLGVSLLGLGEILSGWLTHSVVGLFMTTGVVTGLGTG